MPKHILMRTPCHKSRKYVLESFYGATVFSTLDLKSGYWQLDMEEDSVQNIAFVTSAGLFEFLHLPFALKNSAA